MIGTDKIRTYVLKEGLTKIANEVSKKTRRPLTSEELMDLRAMVEQMPIQELQKTDHNSYVPRLAQLFLTRRENKPVFADYNIKVGNQDADMHEYMRKEVQSLAPAENQLKFSTFADRRGKALPQKFNVDPIANVMPAIDRILAQSDITTNYLQGVLIKSSYRTNELLQGLLGPESVTESLRNVKNSLITYDNVTLPRRTILFDSRNSAPNQGYSWRFVEMNQNNARGDIAIPDTLQQIVEVRCAPFYFPIPVNNQNIMFYKKFYMGIEQFTGQNIVNSINEDISRKIFYTFEFTSEIVGNYLFLKPQNIWKPARVINQCSNITVRFFGSEQIIPDPDRLSCAVSNTNPAVVTTFTAHNIATGDLVYFSESGNYTLDTEAGYFATVLSATTFSIPLDLSALPGSLTASVFFASKKIAFELGFICLEH